MKTNQESKEEILKKLEELKELNADLEFKRLQANLIFSRLFEDETESIFSAKNFPLTLIILLQIVNLILIFFKK